MKQVKFSKLASFKLDLLLEYLESNWSAKSKTKFVAQLTKKINVISLNPKAFPESELRPGLRKCVITKQTSLLYQQKENVVFVVTLYDNRQSQSEIEEEVKKHFS